MLAFRRGDLIFVFNWNPTKSFDGYGFLAPAGEYEVALDSDSKDFGGFGLVDDSVHHFTTPDPLYSPSGKGWLKMYIPSRTAQVLRMVKPKPRKRVKKESDSPAEPKTEKTAVKTVAKTVKPAKEKTEKHQKQQRQRSRQRLRLLRRQAKPAKTTRKKHEEA